ncbi:MAG: tyrosine-type recombinase/integrase [Methanobacteriaceae archaeon]|nr:tyrosine-type recombinase/integrase [Methanobacteriaceae archaeon]
MTKENLNQFIEYIKYNEGLSQNTQKTYTNNINQYQKYLTENNITITKENINTTLQNFITYLTKTRHLKTTTINNYSITIIKYLKFLGYNINKYKPKKPTRTEILEKQIHYFTEPEIQELKTTIYQSENKQKERTILLIEFMNQTGLRIHELLNITLEEYQEAETVHDLKVLNIVGKGNKRRIIAIKPNLQQIINNYLKTRKKESRYIFNTNKSEQMNVRTAQRLIKNTGIKTDIRLNTDTYTKRAHAHAFRHSFAIRAINKLSINKVQKLLGHSSISTTQIYTNINKQEMIEAYMAL